jgi:hypothetical protein
MDTDVTADTGPVCRPFTGRAFSEDEELAELVGEKRRDAARDQTPLGRRSVEPVIGRAGLQRPGFCK